MSGLLADLSTQLQYYMMFYRQIPVIRFVISQ
jgi:hypothetical protein